MEENFDISNIIEEVKVLTEENDRFDTYSKAKSICDFLELDLNQKILEQNNLIAIYGSWGVGKSCLMQTIQANLDNNKFETLWFDTWKYEKDENLPYSLMKFIGRKTFLEELTQKAADAGCFLYGLFSSIAKGFEVEFGIPKLANVTLNLGESIKSLEEYTQKIDEQAEKDMCLWEKVQWFENEFKNLKVTEDSNKKLIVFLDDLDRCESENIITLISSIKLLLSVNTNIIFILGIDKDAVTLALKNKYSNDDNKADAYLEKIFPITFEINGKLMSENFKTYISDITGLNSEDAQFIVEFFYKINFTNSRHIKKVMRKYYFSKEFVISKGYDLNNKFNVVFMLYNIILNIFYNDEYQYLLLEQPEVKYKEIIFFTSTNGNRIEYCFQTRTKSISIETGKYEHSLYKFCEKYSSYKIQNNNVSGVGHMEFNKWQAVFEDNICSRFVEFVIKNSSFLSYFVTEEPNRTYKDNEFNEFIKNLNNIM